MFVYVSDKLCLLIQISSIKGLLIQQKRSCWLSCPAIPPSACWIPFLPQCSRSYHKTYSDSYFLSLDLVMYCLHSRLQCYSDPEEMPSGQLWHQQLLTGITSSFLSKILECAVYNRLTTLPRITSMIVTTLASKRCTPQKLTFWQLLRRFMPLDQHSH